MAVARRYASRIQRRYLVDFCSSWILEGDTPLEQIDMETVIVDRIAEYDGRGFKLGKYYNNATSEMKKRLIRDIKKQVKMFLSIRKAV